MLAKLSLGPPSCTQVPSGLEMPVSDIEDFIKQRIAQKKSKIAKAAAEVKTLKRNIDACKKQFQLAGANVTMVFDRGIISDDNAQRIQSHPPCSLNQRVTAGASVVGCGGSFVAFGNNHFESVSGGLVVARSASHHVDPDLVVAACRELALELVLSNGTVEHGHLDFTRRKDIE